MATSTLVPLEQYLHTSYEPECEWVDGVLKEKSMPDWYHGYFELLIAELIKRYSGGRLRAIPEARTRTSERSWRVPDVAAIPSDVPFLPSPKVTPAICVEILSPDDRESDLLEKIEDYVKHGVGAIWIVDPRRRTIATADATGLHQVAEFQLPQFGAKITAAEIFAELDELEAL